MKIIVTGGAGFIGSHLCERLLKEGNKVICLDNLITGDKKNIAELMNNPNFEFLEHDITEPIELMGIDLIFNLACPASPVDYQNIPLETLWVSAAGTKNMLDLAVKNRAMFLQASTSEVYGDPQEHPQKENYLGNVNCIGIRSCYDEGKRFAESLTVNYAKQYGIQTKIVRIFNTYGPRMRANDGRVIPNFINAALNNEDLIIYGNGGQTRSFCYIDDLAEGIILMMNKDKFAGPVNLGNDKEITIQALAEKIIELTVSKSKILNKEKAQDDPKLRCPDLSLAKAELGYEPRIKTEEGLIKTVKWFKKLMS